MGVGDGLSVLVLDDEQVIVTLLRKVLAAEGFQVTAAFSCTEAIRSLGSSRFDLIIADKNLPDGSGLDVVSKVRELDLDCEVILITAYESIDSAIDAVRHGISAYLPKPFDIDAFKGLVRRTTRLIRARRENARLSLELASSERRLRSIFSQLPFGTGVVVDGAVDYVTPKVSALVHQDVGADLKGHAFAGLFAAQEQQRVVEALSRVTTTGAPVRLRDVTLRGKNDETVPVECDLLPLGQTDGGLPVVFVVRDLREQRAMQARFVHADRMASVGVLASGVAHEVNNPLAYVIANQEYVVGELTQIAQAIGRIARDRPPDVGIEVCAELARHLATLEELVSVLGEAREGCQRIRTIVRDLKIFSRKEEAHSVPLDVRKVLESTLNMAWNEIRHRARLVKELHPVPLVAGDETRLGQVFLNLVLNAAQAIEEGDATNNMIRLVTETAPDDKVVIRIIDTGHGIEPEKIQRVFEPFFTTKGPGAGTGLGLAIVHGIVQEIGGDISVTSEVGKGTTFTVTLPSLRPVDAAAAKAEKCTARATARAARV